MLCSARRNSSKSKWEESAAVLFGIHVLPLAASRPLRRAGILFFMDGAPRKRGRESLTQACVAPTCCGGAIRRPWAFYVPPELPLVCVSASLAVNECGGEGQTRRDLCKSNGGVSSGLPSSLAWRFLGFAPQCEIINLITSLERLLKEYTSKGSVFIQVFLSYHVGRKGGRMKENRRGVRRPVKCGRKAKENGQSGCF